MTAPIPQTAHKAYVAGAIAFLAPILSYVGTWLSGTGEWVWRPFWAFVIASVLAGLTGYGFTWRTSNKPKSLPEHSAAAVALENSHSPSMEG